MDAETKTTEVTEAKKGALDRFFRISERGSTVKTEIFAGLLMFFEVICMAAVSAQLIAANAGIASFSTVYFGMILATIIGTVFVGLVCNAPLVQSVSMGAVVLIVSTLTQNLGLTLANVMMIAFVANIIYLIVMVVRPARRFVAAAVPEGVKKALPAALGAYLLVYALGQLNVFGYTQNNYSDVLESMAAAGEKIAYWGVTTMSTGVENAAASGWYAIMAVVTAVIAVVALLVLRAKKVRHAPMWTFLITLVCYLALWAIRANFADYYLYAFFTPAYGGMYFYDGVTRINGEYTATVLGKLFSEGFDFTNYTNYMTYLASQSTGAAQAAGYGGKILGIILSTVVSFLILGVSETAASVEGAALMSGEDRPAFLSRRLRALPESVGDVYSVSALTSVIGCVLGAGPVTPRGESTVGALEGGRTGLSAVTAGVLCIVSLFNLIFSALFLDGIIVMGILIFTAMVLLCGLRRCDFSELTSALPFLATVAAAGLSQNIGTAVLLGIFTDVLLRALTGKLKEIHIGSWILAAYFAVSQVIALF